MTNLEIAALELLANSALLNLSDKFAEAMSARDYELAARLSGSMLLMTSSLCLMKDATVVACSDEIITKAVEKLQCEVDLIFAIMDGGTNGN